MSMTSFNYGQAADYSKSQSKTYLKDREGVDFEPQILSQKRFHTKFHTETNVSGDEKFDIRRYFPRNHIREFYIEESEIYAKEAKLVAEGKLESVGQHEKGGDYDSGSYRGYRGRRGRGGRGDRGGRHVHDYRESHDKQMYVPKELNEEVTLESCNMANYMNLAM